jgi:GntR family transcriptional repressor for pyruvate dehydrogenase complex
MVDERRPDLSQQLVRRVLHLIESGNLKPGDRLPTMRELAAQFAVATPTLREAMRRLQALGVVDIRHGSGIYVRKVTQGLVIANPHHIEVDAGTVIELLDARLAIEPSLARKAAERATDEDLAMLKAVLAEAEHALNGQDAKLHKANMRFHSGVGRVSGNRILGDFLESLVDLYGREQLGILEVFNARVEDFREHVTIFEAIAAHDPERAAQLMTDHLVGVRDVVRERLAAEAAST